VVSPKSYNAKVGLLLACPITNQIKGYPFEVVLPRNLEVQGAVLSDHVKSLDWRARKAKLICALPQSQMESVIGKLLALVRGF
jgi:mRNA interferase MazF